MDLQVVAHRSEPHPFALEGQNGKSFHMFNGQRLDLVNVNIDANDSSVLII